MYYATTKISRHHKNLKYWEFAVKLYKWHPIIVNNLIVRFLYMSFATIRSQRVLKFVNEHNPPVVKTVTRASLSVFHITCTIQYKAQETALITPFNPSLLGFEWWITSTNSAEEGYACKVEWRPTILPQNHGQSLLQWYKIRQGLLFSLSLKVKRRSASNLTSETMQLLLQFCHIRMVPLFSLDLLGIS